MRSAPDALRALTATLLALIAAGCGPPSGSGETAPAAAASEGAAAVRLVFAHTSTQGKLRDLMDGFVSSFEGTHPGVDVRQVVLDDDDYQKFGLLNLFTGSSSPDIFFQWGGYLVGRDARAGFSTDLTPWIERDHARERFIPGRWFGATWRDGTYMLPQTVNVSVALFYNRAIFRRHGLEPPGDWPGLLRSCAVLRQAGVTPIVAGNKDLWMAGNWAAHIASRVVGEDEYHRALSLERGHRFDGPGWVEALGLLAELVRARAFNAGAVSLTDAEATAEFLTGKAAMIPDGNWLVAEITRANENGAGLDYGVFNTPPIPGERGDPHSVMAVCNGYCIGKHSRHPELAWEFLRDFLTPERQRAWTREGIISPVRNAAAGENPETAAVIGLLERGGRKVSPPDTGYPPVAWSALYDAVQQVLAGNSAPRAALEEAERAIAVFSPRR